MALWLVRAGRHGEHEKKFLDEGRIYLTWNGLATDLSKVPDREALARIYQSTYPDASVGRMRNNLGQLWGFVWGIHVGDWVILPSKYKPAGVLPHFHGRSS